MSASLDPQAGPFEICFESLFMNGRGMVFPCDARGSVDLDALPARARCNYLYARALVGRDYASPFVARAAELADVSSGAARASERAAGLLSSRAQIFLSSRPA